MSKPLILAGPHGRIEVAADALESLVAGAVGLTDGVALARGRRAIEVDVRDGSLGVDVALTAAAGLVLPEVASQAQQAVARALEGTTGIRPTVDVAVVGVEE